MSDDKSKATEKGKARARLRATRDMTETIKQLQADVENIFSVVENSQILAFIGLGLTFWGALFFFVRPLGYVQSSLLDWSAISSYSTIDRIIKGLKYKGKCYYIPPSPKGVSFSKDPSGPKDIIAFISADRETHMPSIIEIAKNKFLLEDPKGICVAPPGLGFLTHFEKRLKKGTTKIQPNELFEVLRQLIIEDFQLAKEIEMKTEEDHVRIKIFDSVYKNLYSERENLKSVRLLGCPLTSAVACIMAETTGKITTIDKDVISTDGQTIEVWYRTVEY
jgi:hypothetical protein